MKCLETMRRLEINMVYIRRDKKKMKRDGEVEKEATYLSIAHNVRERAGTGSRTKPIVLASLGPEEQISSQMASSIVKAFERYAAKRLGQTPSKDKVEKLAVETRATPRIADPGVKRTGNTSQGFGALENAWYRRCPQGFREKTHQNRVAT